MSLCRSMTERAGAGCVLVRRQVMEFFEHDLKGLLRLQKKSNRARRVAMLGVEGEAALRSHKEPPFLVAEVKCLMLQLLRAMEYIHRCWFIHRDLKTANIL